MSPHWFTNCIFSTGDCRTADIVFIVDSSGSIKQTNPGDWDLVLNFLRQAIGDLAKFSNDIRFGIVTFSYEARLVFDLNAYRSVNDVVNAVSTIPYIGKCNKYAFFCIMEEYYDKKEGGFKIKLRWR